MSNYPGSIDLAVRMPAAGQDKRSGVQYAADLAHETEMSLRRDGERWPSITSAELGSRSDRPDKGRWSS